MGLLTELQIKSARHRDKEYFLADGDGRRLQSADEKVWDVRTGPLFVKTRQAQSNGAGSFLVDDAASALAKVKNRRREARTLRRFIHVSGRRLHEISLRR